MCCFGFSFHIRDLDCKDMKFNPETEDYEHELGVETLDSWFMGDKAPLVQHAWEE